MSTKASAKGMCRVSTPRMQQLEPLAAGPRPTSSGRQRRPTEKENYRISERHQVSHRNREKEKISEKRNKKALQTAYRTNPEEFECEPEELHSDIDSDEDNMFSESDRSVPTKLSNPTALVFSAGKIPPASVMPPAVLRSIRSATTGKSVTNDGRVTRHKVPSTSGDDSDPDSTADSEHSTAALPRPADGDDVNTLPMVIGIKRSHNPTSEDVAVSISKVKSASDGSRKRLKASDFDHISKEILATASSIYRCLIVTRAPFPDNVLFETTLAKEAWHEACTMKGVNVNITPALVKMLLRRTSQVRGELKTKMRATTASFFGFRASESKEAVTSNRDLAERLKEGSRFVYQDWERKTGIYKTELLQSAVNIMWFANRTDEGITYHKLFDPLPLELMALVLATVECCIDEWITGFREDVQFTSVTYAAVYNAHLDSLRRFEEHTIAYKLLEKIRINLHEIARSNAGAEAVMRSVVSRIADEAFEEAIQEYQIEEQDA